MKHKDYMAFLNEQQEKYNTVRTELQFKNFDILDLLFTKEDETEKIKRYFFNGMKPLNAYCNLLKLKEIEASNQGFFSRIFNNYSSEYNSILYEKIRHEDELDQLLLCNKCKCSSCFKKCIFDSCLNCKKEFIINCDKERYCIMSHQKKITLWNEDFQEEQKFNVQAILTDSKTKKRYILLQDENDKDNQQLLEFNESITGEYSYDSLETEEKVAEIYNIFVKLGIR